MGFSSDLLVSYSGKIAHVWLGETRVSGLVTYDQLPSGLYAGYIKVQDLQVATLSHIISIEAITAFSTDSNVDTMEKFNKMKTEQEAKQKAAADEYRRIADELEKEEKKNATNGNRAN